MKPRHSELQDTAQSWPAASGARKSPLQIPKLGAEGAHRHCRLRGLIRYRMIPHHHSTPNLQRSTHTASYPSLANRTVAFHAAARRLTFSQPGSSR